MSQSVSSHSTTHSAAAPAARRNVQTEISKKEAEATAETPGTRTIFGVVGRSSANGYRLCLAAPVCCMCACVPALKCVNSSHFSARERERERDRESERAREGARERVRMGASERSTERGRERERKKGRGNKREEKQKETPKEKVTETVGFEQKNSKALFTWV